MTRWLRTLGIAVRILVLGQLLALALAEMYVVQTGARVFAYAGF